MDASSLKWLLDVIQHNPLLGVVAFLLFWLFGLYRGWFYVAKPIDERVADLTRQRDMYKQLTDDLTSAFNRAIDVMEVMYEGVDDSPRSTLPIKKMRRRINDPK